MLTAAHCVDHYDESEILVVVAEHDQTDGSDGTRHEVDRIQNHPNYDFSMLHLIKSVDLGELAITACLPDMRFSGDALVGKYLTVSGWGSHDYDDPIYPDELHSVDVPVISNSDCSNAYAGMFKINEWEICAGYEEGGKDACSGDSGGM